MIAWLVMAAMVVIAVGGLAWPFPRRARGPMAGEASADSFRAAWERIDTRVAAATLTLAEADAERAALGRRMLETICAREASPAGSRRWWITPAVLAAAVGLAALGLYLAVARPEMPRPGGSSAAAAPAHPGGDVATLIGQLEAKMRQAPNDPEGWRMLGWSYMQVGRYAEAASAYGRAASLDPTNPDYLSAEGEAMTQAADGQVTGPARAAFAGTLARDPADPRARFFLAVAKDQAGDHAGADADWRALLRDAPPDAPWTRDVRAYVARVAGDRASPGAVAEAPPAPGPSAEEADRARSLPAADQQAMIEGMVDRLAQRLRASPRDADGWTRLIRARMVLGQTDEARAALRRGLAAFSDAPLQQARLRQSARDLRVPGA